MWLFTIPLRYLFGLAPGLGPRALVRRPRLIPISDVVTIALALEVSSIRGSLLLNYSMDR